MPAQSFERDVVHAFNDYASTYDKRLIAYRHYQMRYQPQLFDVLVDSRQNEFYLAFECKSIDPSTVSQLYFKKHFTWQNGVCQVVREDTWLDRSGRNGFLVVELRRSKPKRTSLYFVPWRVVYYNFHYGDPGITAKEILSCPVCTKSGGKYTFDDEFIEQVIKQLDSYPKDSTKAYKQKWRI